MKNSLPLNDYHIKKIHLIINRLHIFLHGIALLPLFYFRLTSLTNSYKTSSFLPHALLLFSELSLSLIWFFSQAPQWNPVVRAAYPERLPGDEKLPPIDVFICTADPNKEPSLGVMNTVMSAMALDYPPGKLHVYLSDDGGSPVTYRAVKRAWEFSKAWIPFCRKYGVKNRCPEAYFLREEEESDDGEFGLSDDHQFVADKKDIEKRYDEFKNSVAKIVADTSDCVSRDHPSLIELINDGNGNEMDKDNEDMPLLVYVAREKRPSHPHNFKAGALNVLLRISAMISNSPYILVLDCDMYCNDPASARQAMCFHMDPKLSPKLGFVQFPQIFHNISQNDIYDCQLRYIWPKFEGIDGLRGPILSGTCFYLKREALHGTQKFLEEVDPIQLNKFFGSSNEFIKSISGHYKPNYTSDRKVLHNVALEKEFKLLASCEYDNDTKWGKEVGFRYFSVVEDYFTGFHLHCEGWISVYYKPIRPCFLGSSPISLGELLVQHTRWYVGLNQVAWSRFSPILYGPLRMSALQSMFYAEFAYSILYVVSLYVLTVVPQLCLICRIPLYPEVSSPFFHVFLLVFLSSQLKHVHEIISSGHSIKAWLNENRMWMMKSLTSYLYAALEVTMEKIGLTKSSFLPTNKVVDDEQVKRYQMGVYDFQASPMFMVPLCTLYVQNVASFVIGFGRILLARNSMMPILQVLIPLFGLGLHFPLLEGMILRKDKGRVSPSVTFLSVAICILVISFVSLGNEVKMI